MEADLIKFYLNAGMREGEPERELGVFKKNCPVSWAKENKLIEGKGELCVVYKVCEKKGILINFPYRGKSIFLHLKSIISCLRHIQIDTLQPLSIYQAAKWLLSESLSRLKI